MVSMSGRGKFGRYLKRATTFPDYLHALTSADAQAVIEDLLRVLAGDGAGLLSRMHEPTGALACKRVNGAAAPVPLRNCPAGPTSLVAAAGSVRPAAVAALSEARVRA